MSQWSLNSFFYKAFPWAQSTAQGSRVQWQLMQKTQLATCAVKTHPFQQDRCSSPFLFLKTHPLWLRDMEMGVRGTSNTWGTLGILSFFADLLAGYGFRRWEGTGTTRHLQIDFFFFFWPSFTFVCANHWTNRDFPPFARADWITGCLSGKCNCPCRSHQAHAHKKRCRAGGQG